MPYLTPDTKPVSTITVSFTIPDDGDWLAVLIGAVLVLTYESNWERFGSLTVAQVVSAWDDILVGATVS